MTNKTVNYCSCFFWLLIIRVFQYRCAASDATSEVIPHDAQCAQRMEDYVHIIYAETKGCDYVYSLLPCDCM